MEMVQKTRSSSRKMRELRMHALSGHIDNNSIVVNGNLSMYEGCDVIVTILDGGQMKNCEGTSKSDEKRKEAARSLAGLWSSHENTVSVDEEVRMLRRGRQFDI